MELISLRVEADIRQIVTYQTKNYTVINAGG